MVRSKKCSVVQKRAIQCTRASRYVAKENVPQAVGTEPIITEMQRPQSTMQSLRKGAARRDIDLHVVSPLCMFT